MSTFKDRMIRAAKLDVSLYEEVEQDKDSLRQATAAVVLASVAAAIGSGHRMGIGGMIAGGVVSLIGWYVWAYLAYLIGTKLLTEPQTHADVGQLLRTTGFSSSPGLIRVLGIIPGLTGIVFFVAWIWMLVTMVVAVRQALDCSGTGRAVAVCVIGWLVQGLILVLFFHLVATPAARITP